MLRCRCVAKNLFVPEMHTSCSQRDEHATNTSGKYVRGTDTGWKVPTLYCILGRTVQDGGKRCRTVVQDGGPSILILISNFMSLLPWET